MHCYCHTPLLGLPMQLGLLVLQFGSFSISQICTTQLQYFCGMYTGVGALDH